MNYYNKCFTTCVPKYKWVSKTRISGLRTTDFGLWNTNLEHRKYYSVTIDFTQRFQSVNLATSFRQFGIDMRMEKIVSSGLQTGKSK